ncbi:hypothetical protein [Flavobacterium azizsancarii]|nr:hypothetical protein [Flavobacterium azizsancarii]
MKTISHKETFLYFILLVTFSSLAQNKSDRELILIDKDWHFSL